MRLLEPRFKVGDRVEASVLVSGGHCGTVKRYRYHHANRQTYHAYHVAWDSGTFQYWLAQRYLRPIHPLQRLAELS